MTPSTPTPVNHHIRHVRSFHELAHTPFAGGVNALCWERKLNGDFGEVIRLLGPGEGIINLDEAALSALPVSPAGRVAVEIMREDLRLLRELNLAPVLNCIHAYPRDEDPEVVATDVYSFHADSAPVEADTWLCTYHGASSEGVPNRETIRRVDLPETRAELLARYGAADDEDFQDFLADNCFDLHYATLPSSRPYAFGTGNLWRIATQWPGSPVPPCIHRAPPNLPGQPPRLLLIS